MIIYGWQRYKVVFPIHHIFYIEKNPEIYKWSTYKFRSILQTSYQQHCGDDFGIKKLKRFVTIYDWSKYIYIYIYIC